MAGQNPFWVKLQLIRMEPLSARPVTELYTRATAPAAAGANGAARWLAIKRMPAHAGINDPNPHTGGASTQNPAGTRAFTHPLPGVRGNT